MIWDSGETLVGVWPTLTTFRQDIDGLKLDPDDPDDSNV